jgi:hypothetical protein
MQTSRYPAVFWALKRTSERITFGVPLDSPEVSFLWRAIKT